jgi:hypothetical protein
MSDADKQANRALARLRVKVNTAFGFLSASASCPNVTAIDGGTLRAESISWQASSTLS